MTTDLEMDIKPEQGDTAMDIGQVLKTKRLALAYPERQVATELKLSIEKVYALENNQFQQFRSPTFVRGYLKSYCRVLELDHRPILKAYDEQLSSKESNIRSVDNVKHQATVRDPIVMIVSVIIIAIIVFVAFWWPSFTGQDDPVAEQTTEQAVEDSASPSETATDSSDAPMSDTAQSASSDDAKADDVAQVNPEAPLQDLDLSALEEADISAEEFEDEVVTGLSAETIALLEDAGLDANDVAEAARANSETNVAPKPDAPEAPAYSNDIVVNFDQDCWTQVRDSTGRTLFSGVKSSGSTLTLNGEPPYRVTLGYAPGVTDFIYKGKSFDFSSHIRNDLARFELE